MCELFGLSYNEKDRAIKSLPVFIEKGDWCQDGWGIGYSDDSKAIGESSAEDISKKPVPKKFHKIVEKANSQTIIAHVRAATNSEADLCNSHPFKTRALERDWIFAHNGSTNLNYPVRPDIASEIDSARLFSHHSWGILCLLPEIPCFHSCPTDCHLVAYLEFAERIIECRLWQIRKTIKFTNNPILALCLSSGGILLGELENQSTIPMLRHVRFW